MNRKFACHRYYVTPEHYERQVVVSVDEKGRIVTYEPFETEVPDTEWIGGIIRKLEDGTAIHISYYDFEHDCPTIQSIISRLTSLDDGTPHIPQP